MQIEFKEMGVPPRMWAIQYAPFDPKEKTIVLIKVKRAPKRRGAKDSKCFVVMLKGETWDHPGNTIVKAGTQTNYASFWSLDDAKQFVEKMRGKESEV